ncbi:hypothetical protein Salmuc_01625 [Salipiger mucosus DSM 16094]|uniref:Uncharacterized protein n=2 Tax=Salipiger mucosus TaxID=263378 RepID=S9S0T7_9RHOB|nr:hypothetical protein Salmuc_01625 [Salipiger mucosus DSM 16094]
MIEKVSGDMEGMSGMMASEDMARVQALVDDARMLLAGGEHDHEMSRSPFDHARAIAKAGAALGHARAADALHFSYMEQ